MPAGLERYRTGVSGGAQRRAAVHRRQEAAAVVAGAAAGSLGAGQHDIARQIGGFAAQTVQRPRAEAGPAELLRAGVHHDLRRGVIDGLGVQRADQAEVVGDFRGVRQDFAQLHAALAVFREGKLGTEQRRVGIDERRPVALEQFRRRQLTVAFREFRLVIEQFQLTRCAGLEHVDHPLGLRRVMRFSRGEWIFAGGSGGRLGGQQRTGRDAGQSDAAVAEKPPAAQVAGTSFVKLL